MRLSRLLLTATAAAMLVLASASIALADSSTARPTALTFGGASPTSVQGQVMLSATLTADGGKPLSGKPIDFYQPVQLLGARDSYLGTALTDSTGTATLGFTPASTGSQSIRASFAGDSGYASSEATGPVVITATGPLFTESPVPLGALGDVLPYAFGAVVLAVWALLAFVLLRTASGIRAASSASWPVRRPAPAGLVAMGAAIRKQSVNVSEEWK